MSQRRLNIFISEELHNRLRRGKEYSGRPITVIVRRAIEAALTGPEYGETARPPSASIPVEPPVRPPAAFVEPKPVEQPKPVETPPEPRQLRWIKLEDGRSIIEEPEPDDVEGQRLLREYEAKLRANREPSWDDGWRPPGNIEEEPKFRGAGPASA